MRYRALIACAVGAAVVFALGVPRGAAAFEMIEAKGTVGTADTKPLVIQGFTMIDTSKASGVSEEIKNKGGKGPNQFKYVDLFTHFDIPNPERVLSLNDRIYFDLEEESGIYYYWPQDYSLAHDPDYGHLFRIRYGMVSADDDDEAPTSNVAVAFTLWGGYSKDDYELLRYLLNKYLEREHLPPCNDLKALPFHSCTFTFGSAQSYGVPDGQISVPVLTDIAGYMDVTLTTDETTVEGLKVALQDIQGLTGKVKLVAASAEGDGIGFAIPELTAHVSLCDTRTYQREPYEKNRGFENHHDFPVRLKTLYFLLDDGDDVRLFEYDLGNRLVLPGQTANLRHDHVNAGLIDRAVRAWYEYRLVNEGDDVQQYWDKVMTRLTVGLGRRTVKMVTVEVLDEDWLDEYGVELVKVKVRSKHFDPNSKRVLTKNYTLDDETPEVTGDALFFIEGEEEEGVSYFEYKIYMIDRNGDVHVDHDWRQGVEDDEGIYIGRRQFNELVGSPDGDDDGDDDIADDDGD